MSVFSSKAVNLFTCFEVYEGYKFLDLIHLCFRAQYYIFYPIVWISHTFSVDIWKLFLIYLILDS